MQGFPGFPPGKLRATPLPTAFFSELLPIIDHLGELKVTLYAFWALHQKEGDVRFLLQEDFTADDAFVASFARPGRDGVDDVLDGLERAVARGTLLHVSIEASDRQREYYFVNTERGRAAVEGITRGEWRPDPAGSPPVSLLIERPNVFVLYEQNIGVLTPLIADELREAEQTFPYEWIESAIKIAVENNARNWRYVSAILERWRLEGKRDEIGRRPSTPQRRQHIPEEYRDIVER